MPPTSEILYQVRGLPIKVGDRFITKDLAEKILLNCKVSSKSDFRNKSKNEIRVVFGLRFENRTWVNQTEGLAELAGHLASNVNNLTIIIDGHDRINDNKLRSHGEGSSKQDLILLEKQVVKEISSYLSKRNLLSHVSIIDAVDLSLNDSISWISIADFFVAPWGSGLAKYKWICNLQGIILTSNYNRDNRSDLDIYENPKVREGATKCSYLDYSYISDDLANNEHYNVKLGVLQELTALNFKVNIEGLKLEALNFLFDGEEK